MKVLTEVERGPQWCDECGKPVAVVLEVGEVPRPDSRTVTICSSCVREAFNTICESEP